MVNNLLAATDTKTAIDFATKELVMRQVAAAHLKGIPARHNATAIDRLYDRLNHLHIANFEAEAQ